MDVIYDTFTFKGRLTRRRFFYLIFVVLIIYSLASLCLFAFIFFGPLTAILSLFLYTFSLLAKLTLLTRRLHDFSAPAYWMLVPILLASFSNSICQILSMISILIIGLIPGNLGQNEYGEDPRQLT